MISVIIPTLNEEKYLPTCLGSIRHQDIKDTIEVIVVDGYSKDRTAEVAKHYGAKVFKQKPQGSAKAKNLGACNASGGIFIFTDADTVFPAGAFQKIKEYYKDRCVVAVGGPLVPTTRAFKHRAMYFLTTDLTPTICSYIHMYQFQGPNTSIRASTFKKINGFNEDLLKLEDNEIIHRAKKHGRIIWDRSFKVFNDARRFEQEGYLGRTVDFTKSFLQMYIFKKKKLGYKYTETR